MRNADEMLRLTSALRATGRADEGGTEAWRDLMDFVDAGHELSSDLHLYGHRATTTNPDWAAAGRWTRRAKEILGTRQVG